MEHSLKDEFAFYVENQKDLGDKYEGKYIVIKSRQVIGHYSSRQEALDTTLKEHSMGTFLLRKCDPDPDSLKETYHSRVRF